MMHTNFVHILDLFSRVIDRLSFRDRKTENVLLSSMPRDELDTGMNDLTDLNRIESRSAGERLLTDGGKVPTFEGVQPLVLKGLMSSASHSSSIEVLSRITIPTCDSIFGNSETRLLMHITGLLPWLGLQLHQEDHQRQKACQVASNIAQWCRAKSADDLAIVFQLYSQGKVSSLEDLFVQTSPLICSLWFPKFSSLAFGHFLRLLERGPLEYQRVVLLLLKSLLQQAPVDPTQIPHVYNAVSQLVESSLCSEALNVLEALLRSCSGLEPDNNNNNGSSSGSNNNNNNGFGEKVFASQTSFKARSGPLGFGSGSGSGFGPGLGKGGGLESGLVTHEVCLQNTRLLLGRVLDTCALGRKRDHKRLVPFVANL
ncbi:hypothetical protein LUZ60_007014 [Juncus effusus]|nr:hypothetical protein LUZ60_007014 [Juncus effusus]